MDPEFVIQVGNILTWAQKHNNNESFHFPVVGVSWGMMTMLKSQIKDTNKFEDFPEKMVGEGL